MYEPRTLQVISRGKFLLRMAWHFIASTGLLAGSLAIGVLGYHAFAGLSWLDALLNASMILTGMGPIGELGTPAAKWFASLYALYSGLMFVVMAGILVTPVFHRLLHKFHVEED
jgi:hypothetical protein